MVAACGVGSKESRQFSRQHPAKHQESALEGRRIRAGDAAIPPNPAVLNPAPTLGGPAQDGASGDEGYASEEDRADFVLGAGDELSTEELASGYPSHWLR